MNHLKKKYIKQIILLSICFCAGVIFTMLTWRVSFMSLLFLPLDIGLFLMIVSDIEEYRMVRKFYTPFLRDANIIQKDEDQKK